MTIYPLKDVKDCLNLTIPLYLNTISAGFPSPAEDYVDTKIDLNAFFIRHPAATFLVVVEGESMIEAGIFPGDLVVVDKSLEAKDGDVIVASLEGEFTIKRLRKQGRKVFLEPANKNFKNIYLTEDSDFLVWGVVTSTIHKFR